MQAHFWCRLAVGVLAFVTSFSTTRASDKVPWALDLTAAQQLAAQRQQLVLIHFWAPDCAPCRQLEDAVFSQPTFARTVTENYVPVKIDVKQFPSLAYQYGVNRWPMDAITTPDGRMVHKMVSPQNDRSYVRVLTDIAARESSRAHAASQQLAAAGPTPSNNAGLASYNRFEPTDMQSRLGDFDNARQQGDRFAPTDLYDTVGARSEANADRPYLQEPSGTRSEPPLSADIHNQYATKRHSDQRPQPSQVDSRRDSYHRAASNAWDRSPPDSSRSTSSREPSTAMTRSGVVPRETEESPGPRQASHRWGIAGYCPVTLIEKSQWVKGDPRWGAVHRGRTYLFTSAAAQKEFLANPDRFSPAMSGIDPVQFTEQRRRVQGSLNYGIVYHDRMYFFADEPSLNRFYATPDRYAGYVQQAMQSFDRQHVRR